MRKRTTTEEIRQYQRDYYWANKDQLRAKYWEEKRQILSRKKYDNDLEMYEDWRKNLQNRLEDEHLEDWLATAIKAQVRQINKEIDKIYGKVTGKTDKENR